MSSENTTSKLYRYEILVQAIDFFTQKFSIDQLVDNAFNFANELLTLNASALFYKNGEQFVQKKNRNYPISDYVIAGSEPLDGIAAYYGHVLTNNFDNFLCLKDIQTFNINVLIPLIANDILVGFIISDGKVTGLFNDDDYIISDTLLKIISNALENAIYAKNIQESNKELDQKVFNLYSVYHSSKALFSELSLDSLYHLATDIFSEVTSSKVTSFGLYDEISKKVIIRSFRDITTYRNRYAEFELLNECYKNSQIVLHIDHDLELIKGIFTNWQDFYALDTEYIVLILKNTNIFGFVTLSKTVNGTALDRAIFELVEALATSTCIALSNAKLYHEVSRQKKVIEQKFHMLSKLNKLIKNINSCLDLDELYNLTMQTLTISFGIKKAFIMILTDDGIYRIERTTGFTLNDHMNIFLPNDLWEDIYQKGLVYYYTSEHQKLLFSQKLLECIGETNCLVISPISLGEMYDSPLGYIVAMQTSESLKEEEILLIDTMSNNIASVIRQMQTMQKIKSEYIVNQREAFLNELKRKIYNREHYLINFFVYYKKILAQPFMDPSLDAYLGYEHFYFDNILFVLSELPLNIDIFDGVLNAADMNDYISDIRKIG